MLLALVFACFFVRRSCILHTVFVVDGGVVVVGFLFCGWSLCVLVADYQLASRFIVDS